MNAESALHAASLDDVQRIVTEAAGKEETLELVGSGSKRYYGRPARAAQQISVAGLEGVVDYQPQELILVARPGTDLRTVESVLGEAGQVLAFEPPHWHESATLGGVLACNLSGPRRFKAGAARDHLLGFQAVTGTGEVIRGGGRVVKNVTGYDLSKLMCGSFGTLGVLTEVVVKVLPRAETERTVVYIGQERSEGLRKLIEASRTSHEPSGLAYLPAGLSLPTELVAAVARGADGGAVTAIRIEGPSPSVKHRSEVLAGKGANLLDEADSRALWECIRELEPMQPASGERMWRFSVPPTAGAVLGSHLDKLGAVRQLYDWGGALVWAAVPAAQDTAALHALAAKTGGHAQIVRCGPDTPFVEPVFSALSEGQRRLTINLKHAFDPKGVLNPGRMYPDI